MIPEILPPPIWSLRVDEASQRHIPSHSVTPAHTTEMLHPTDTTTTQCPPSLTRISTGKPAPSLEASRILSQPRNPCQAPMGPSRDRVDLPEEARSSPPPGSCTSARPQAVSCHTFPFGCNIPVRGSCRSPCRSRIRPPAAAAAPPRPARTRQLSVIRQTSSDTMVRTWRGCPLPLTDRGANRYLGTAWGTHRR